jgi:iron complex transport system ATP-binding protein
MSLHTLPLTVQRGARRVLDVPALQLAPGLVHAVLGPNGAGKSTLLHALAGLLPPMASKVRLDGRPLTAWPPEALARQRALLSQSHVVPFDFLVDDIVQMGRYPHRRHPHPDETLLPRQLLGRTGAAHLLGRHHATLSGGEQARVQLARVLAQIARHAGSTGHRWLLLDEPTAALDLAHQLAVGKLLRELAAEGVGIVVVLHDLNLALSCADRVLVLQDGQLVCQGACEAVLQADLVKRVWGVHCTPLSGAGPRALRWLAFS